MNVLTRIDTTEESGEGRGRGAEVRTAHRVADALGVPVGRVRWLEHETPRAVWAGRGWYLSSEAQS